MNVPSVWQNVNRKRTHQWDDLQLVVMLLLSESCSSSLPCSASPPSRGGRHLPLASTAAHLYLNPSSGAFLKRLLMEARRWIVASPVWTFLPCVPSQSATGSRIPVDQSLFFPIPVCDHIPVRPSTVVFWVALGFFLRRSVFSSLCTLVVSTLNFRSFFTHLGHVCV